MSLLSRLREPSRLLVDEAGALPASVLHAVRIIDTAKLAVRNRAFRPESVWVGVVSDLCD